MKVLCLKISNCLIFLSVMYIISLTAVTASAFVPEDLERLKKEKNCPGCDLRAADL